MIVEENLNLRKLDRNNLHASVRQCAPPSDSFCSLFFSLSCLLQNLMLNAFISLPLPNPYMIMSKGHCSWGVVESVLLLSIKTGLKPMQPMQLHWAELSASERNRENAYYEWYCFIALFRLPATWARKARHGMKLYEHWQGPKERARVNNLVKCGPGVVT